jgi:hypothetical protein
MKKRILIIGGILVFVLLLAGAAFVGGQLVNGHGLSARASSGGLTLFSSQGEEIHNSLHIQPAKELPQTPADAKGVFDHRQDNSIFVGTGQVHIMVQPDQSGKVQTSSNHDGPTIEVVVTPQTTVYRDVTMKQFNYQPVARGGTVQQVVELGSLDEVGQNSLITAWGKKTGDRIIADVLVYTPAR